MQNGSKYKLCIFKTTNKGWGVKTLETIPKGAFVSEYVGEVVTEDNAKARQVKYGNTYFYLLNFDNFESPKEIDATVKGNASRFVNHSCNPNCEVYNVYVNCLDPSLPRIAYFAKNR